ncbi:MAG: HAD-IIIA family hydrolase, partial [Actinomycetota bacterium]|nr:HAD-IIIA family hydrolase [Actinomycetota bacterium]
MTPAPGPRASATNGGLQPGIDIVVPTIGRPSLAVLFEALAAQTQLPGRVVVVDDRRGGGPLAGVPPALTVRVVPSGGRGPAAARNAGWRAGTAEWVAFLDDDVVPPPEWFATLIADLSRLPDEVAASQGGIRVPLPAGRRPTDWERNVAGLERARWATADMAYRRRVLETVGGFDERFVRAYREDADLGLRVVGAGWRIERGARRVTHPARPADRWVSLRLQRGNADDMLMRALHGPGWRAAAGVPEGRRRRHLAISAAGLVAVAAPPRTVRKLATAAWAFGTAELAWARIRPGPRTATEVATMVATSVAMPWAAAWHTLAGAARWRAARRPEVLPGGEQLTLAPAAVLFDRDGTLVEDVPYNPDPSRVVPMPGAEEALRRLRAAGVATAVVSNQSGIGRGRLTPAEVEAVNARVQELLGPLGPVVVCPHA